MGDSAPNVAELEHYLLRYLTLQRDIKRINRGGTEIGI
jgi:hypothetical protein